MGGNDGGHDVPRFIANEHDALIDGLGIPDAGRRVPATTRTSAEARPRCHILLLADHLPRRAGPVNEDWGFDNSILLDSTWLEWADPIWDLLASGPPEALMWDFSYPHFVRELKTSATRLGLHLVPYQARHSGRRSTEPTEHGRRGKSASGVAGGFSRA